MHIDVSTDEELMVMYQNGSENAFQVLYDRHSSKVFGFLKSRIKTDEKVQDIYQDVFIKIHKSKHLYNKALPVLPWIFTITRSVMIDELRKDKSSKFVDDFDLEKIEQPIKSENENFGHALKKINELPQSQKVALQMRYVDDHTFEEIALSLKTSPLNVRQLISRGVKRLKELIENEEKS